MHKNQYGSATTDWRAVYGSVRSDWQEIFNVPTGAFFHRITVTRPDLLALLFPKPGEEVSLYSQLPEGTQIREIHFNGTNLEILLVASAMLPESVTTKRAFRVLPELDVLTPVANTKGVKDE